MKLWFYSLSYLLQKYSCNWCDSWGMQMRSATQPYQQPSPNSLPQTTIHPPPPSCHFKQLFFSPASHPALPRWHLLKRKRFKKSLTDLNDGNCLNPSHKRHLLWLSRRYSKECTRRLRKTPFPDLWSWDGSLVQVPTVELRRKLSICKQNDTPLLRQDGKLYCIKVKAF